MRHQCILHCPLDTAHHRDEPTYAPHPLEPHRVPHPNPPWGRDDDGDVGDGELIHMYYVVGPCTSWPRALSLTLARALSAAGRQQPLPLPLALPTALLAPLFRFVWFVHTMAGHKICAFLIQVYTCVCVCLYVFIYLFMCVFVYLSVCVRSCDLF